MQRRYACIEGYPQVKEEFASALKLRLFVAAVHQRAGLGCGYTVQALNFAVHVPLLLRCSPGRSAAISGWHRTATLQLQWVAARATPSAGEGREGTYACRVVITPSCPPDRGRPRLTGPAAQIARNRNERQVRSPIRLLGLGSLGSSTCVQESSTCFVSRRHTHSLS